jgi:CNT family concentrative nucleoside transporter
MSASAPSASVSEPTPISWRIGLGCIVVVLVGAGLICEWFRWPQGRSAFGALALIAVVGIFSQNLREVSLRTLLWGIALQVFLALFVLKFGFTRTSTPEMLERYEVSRAVAVLGTSDPIAKAAMSQLESPKTYFYRPGYAFFSFVGAIVQKFLEFTAEGAKFVFGALADPPRLGNAIPGGGFVFAFSALPTIIFVSSFFTVLYFLGVLQWIVHVLARVMTYTMGTTGPETLSATANVFMGQTEAPLIVKPYVIKMTESELLALMVGGMATISGGLMAVYIGMGADAVSILATSVMAAPCGLYLSKLLMPEMKRKPTPETTPESARQEKCCCKRDGKEPTYGTVIEAAAAGAKDGLNLALNVAAMLIAFLAFLALIDASLQWFHPGLGLRSIFGTIFAPVAFLMGVETKDLFTVGDLLGTKLVANEFVAYTKLTVDYRETISPRSAALATFALTGFANFSSIGIQIAGIGAMAEERKKDLARLGGRALFVGFVATLVNAAVAGALM